MNLNTFARRYTLCIGVLDFFSGLGLVLVPVLTLRLMQIAVPGSEALVFVRFVGVFVASIGACYLWALLAPGRRLRTVFRVTIFFRASVGLFTAACVLTGTLDKGWLLVTAADAGIVLIQSWLLARGVGRAS